MADGQQYTERRITVARTARWGLVGSLDAATTDVWIVLHGYGHLAASFAASATWPVSTTRAFAFPEALQRFYDAAPGVSHADAPVGASWMTREARDDDIADNHASLDALRGEILAKAPEAAITVSGFSQGAATAARWSERCVRNAMPLARLVLWGGLLPPDVDIGPAAPLRRIPVSLVVGSRDRWVTPSRLAAEESRLAAAHFPLAIRRFEGGHRLDDATLDAIITSS